MDQLLIYIIKVSIVLMLMYSFHALLLKRDTLHGFNRFVLKAILMGSMVLPLIHFYTGSDNVVTTAAQRVEYQLSSEAIHYEIDAFRDRNSIGKETIEFSVADMLSYLYAAGLIAFALFYLRNLWSVVAILRRGKRIELPEFPDAKIVVNNSLKSPFSWFCYIAISEKDLRDNGHVFLQHEMAHIRKRHSLDMLMCEFIVRLQWFNPFAWMLREDLSNLHEYQADESVLDAGVDIDHYNHLLIRKAVGNRFTPVVNGLSASALKRRFKMMYTKRSSNWKKLKILYTLPLLAFCICMFGQKSLLDVKVSTPDREDKPVLYDSIDLNTPVVEVVPAESSMNIKVNGIKLPDDAEIVGLEEVEHMYAGVDSSLVPKLHYFIDNREVTKEEMEKYGTLKNIVIKNDTVFGFVVKDTSKVMVVSSNSSEEISMKHHGNYDPYIELLRKRIYNAIK